MFHTLIDSSHETRICEHVSSSFPQNTHRISPNNTPLLCKFCFVANLSDSALHTKNLADGMTFKFQSISNTFKTPPVSCFTNLLYADFTVNVYNGGSIQIRMSSTSCHSVT